MSVHLRDVAKAFGGAPAVRGVSVDVAPGEFFVVLGPSGCGKSTLLRLIAGLETLDAGRIALAGREVSGPGRHLAPEARRVAVVFQSYALWPHLSVRDNVAFPVEAAGRPRREARAEADRRLGAVALTGFGDRMPADLSGGQRQRVALARCLASRAETVLMDEPLANLDPHLRGAMEGELAAFHRAAGATTIYITHDQREAMALADRVAVMREGRIEQAAPPEDVHDRPATEAVARFIGRGAVTGVQVARVDGAAAHIPALGLAAACAPGTPPGPARLLLRPDHARIAEAPDARPARLRHAAYRGGVWEADADLAGLDEPVPVSSRSRLREGEVVPLRLTGGWVLPG